MKSSNEDGAVMLESTYCILLVILVFMFMISFGFFLYQKAMIGIVANEVAEEVAQTYKLRNVTDNSTLTVDDITGVGKYRYLFFKSSFENKNKLKAYNFADMRLSKTSLAQDSGSLTVNIETVIDDIGRRHYEVTVKKKYSFLLGDLLNVIGQDGTQELQSTAYVESVDVLNYINTVKFTKYGINKLKENSAFFDLIDSAISLLHSIFDD